MPKRTKEEISNDKRSEEIGGLDTTKNCPKCSSDDTCEVGVGCMCRRSDGHSCWSAPHCNKCGFTGAGNSSGGLWIKPSYW